MVPAMLAGAYIGVVVVLMVSAAGPPMAADGGFAKLVGGFVFEALLTIVVFAGQVAASAALHSNPAAE